MLLGAGELFCSLVLKFLKHCHEMCGDAKVGTSVRSWVLLV